jgi:hypothetical protein
MSIAGVGWGGEAEQRMSERSPQYHHVLRYKQILKRWQEANLGAEMCHRIAAIEARKAFPLPEELQAEVDAWLDEKYPEQKRERPREDYPLVFDDVSRAE